MELTQGKRLVLCARGKNKMWFYKLGFSLRRLFEYYNHKKLRKKRKCDFFFCLRHTRRINWGFSLGRLFECYNHKSWGKKENEIFLCSRHTRKINWEFSLGKLFGCYNHRELKYSEWKILLPDFVVGLYLFLEILLYFPNLLWTQVLGITWVL